MSGSDALIKAAWAAAPAFGLEPKAITLLSESENVVYEVTLDDADPVAMRLHRPGYNTLAELDSEVQWVQALGISGIPVPTAVPALDGGHYVSVPVGDEGRFVGVVEWIHGAPLGGAIEAKGGDVVSHYATIGQLAARIRKHSQQQAIPAEFTRRRWDSDGLIGETPLWGRFWEADGLSAGQRELFRTCQQHLHLYLDGLPTSSEHFGLIHADLHLGNLMADGIELTVIDFDDAGFGWYAYELAVALHPVLEEPWEQEARAALLDGYRQVHPLSADEEDQIDLFLTVRCLLIVGWLDARKELPLYQHFSTLAAQAERMATRYLARPSG